MFDECLHLAIPKIQRYQHAQHAVPWTGPNISRDCHRWAAILTHPLSKAFGIPSTSQCQLVTIGDGQGSMNMYEPNVWEEHVLGIYSGSTVGICWQIFSDFTM